MTGSSPDKRRTWLAATAVAAALAGVGAWASDGIPARERALRRGVAAYADELAASGGILDGEGELLIGRPLEVKVVQGGGGLWAGRVVGETIDGSKGFRAAESPHLLRVESVETPRGFFVDLRLWRTGWDLRLPDGFRRRMQPELFAAAAGAGALVWGLSRRLVWGVLFAALAVLVAGVALPLGGPVPAWGGLTDELTRAPLWTGVSRLLAANEQVATASLVSLIVFCLVLAFFDHRRSKTRPDALSVPRALVDALGLGFGGLVLLEGALRTGWWDALWGSAGGLGALALVAACVFARLAASRARA